MTDIIRLEVERRGASYRHVVAKREPAETPELVQYRMNLKSIIKLLNVCCLHLADEKPITFEDRWLIPATIPEVFDVDFDTLSANEWFVKNVLFSKG